MAKGYVVGANKCLIPSYDAEEIEEISGYFVGEWSDGNPNSEDRTGRFVTSSNSSNKIELASADSYVSGVSEAYEGSTKKAKVNPIGLSVVQDDGTLVAGDKCMPSTNGIAKKSSNNLGYRVVGRVDSKHVQVIVAPNNDMVQRIKSNVLTYEEIKASTNLSGKIASAEALKSAISLDLYWQNSTPGSDFPAQDITLNNKYDAVLITIRFWKSTELYTNILLLNDNLRVNANYADSTGSVRPFRFENKTVHIGTGHNYGKTMESDNDGLLVPYKIYGVKFITL